MEYAEGEGKVKEEAVLDALAKLGATRAEVEIEVMKKVSKKLFGLVGEDKITVRAYKKQNISDAINDDKISRAVKTLEDILYRIESKGIIEKEENSENEITLTISGGEGGLLIGRRGETLDALEYIVNMIVNNDSGSRLFVHIDTENYRSKRKAKLEKLAINAAAEVKRKGIPYKIQNLNAKERKIIHMTIRKEENVETVSYGEGYSRTIVIKRQIKGCFPNEVFEKVELN